MDWRRLRTTLRFDGAAWRRFAELGCVYGPEWWKRGSPPVIAAIIFAIARTQRAAVLANQRRICGPRGWLRERWHAYRVFAEFARSVTEAMEQWGPRPRPLELHVVGSELFEAALAERRGLVVLTGHFGSWEVAARHLARLGRPVNMVVAHEPNPSVRDFMHAIRTRHGFHVIYSDRSVFRRYQVRVVGRFTPKTPAESVAALAATVRAYERLVRERPAQWLMFEDVWGAPPARGRAAAETLPQAS